MRGPFGIMQPPPDNEMVSPDVILMPLLAFDAAGNRLGQGGGHYDRALAALPGAIRIGVAWSVQQIDAVPADSWDIPMHAVVTEKGWMTL